MVAEPEVSSSNPGGHDLLKKIKKITVYSYPSCLHLKELHMRESVKP
jgi:hypothetical protein